MTNQFNLHTMGRVPEGMISFFAEATPPNGWLVCDGAAVSKTKYPKLFNAIGYRYGNNNQNEDEFMLPDMRGLFPRAWDDNKGAEPKDPGRTFGTYQEDTIQNITAEFRAMLYDFFEYNMDGAVHAHVGNFPSERCVGEGVNHTKMGYRFDASRVARTSHENRPKNFSLLAVIKCDEEESVIPCCSCQCGNGNSPSSSPSISSSSSSSPKWAFAEGIHCPHCGKVSNPSNGNYLPYNPENGGHIVICDYCHVEYKMTDEQFYKWMGINVHSIDCPNCGLTPRNGHNSYVSWPTGGYILTCENCSCSYPISEEELQQIRNGGNEPSPSESSSSSNSSETSAVQCIHPVNFRQVDVSEHNGNIGVLGFRYEWESPTGDLADLKDCIVFEHSSYPDANGNDLYIAPNPPFNDKWKLINPTILTHAGSKGFIKDTHDRLGFSQPYTPAYFKCIQYYRYRCNKCMNENESKILKGPMTIERSVYFDPDNGGWRYTVKKDGYSATINLS